MFQNYSSEPHLPDDNPLTQVMQKYFSLFKKKNPQEKS